MLLSGQWLYAQDAKTYVYKGNKLYSEKKYDEAAAEYNKSVSDKKMALKGNFNLGDALYKEKKFDDAAQHFNDIASSTNNQSLQAGAYHNLGNTFLDQKKYQESINAYEKSLLNNPKDDQTRYNLAYAQEKLKQQQQQKKKQDKNNQNNKNQQNKDKQKQDQDKKDQDKKNQDNKNQQNKDQQNKQQQQQPDKVSKEDAQRMLDALNNSEKDTQDKLKDKKFKAGKATITKDW
jgi:Ca-activated chloride channel family protein